MVQTKLALSKIIGQFISHFPLVLKKRAGTNMMPAPFESTINYQESNSCILSSYNLQDNYSIHMDNRPQAAVPPLDMLHTEI